MHLTAQCPGDLPPTDRGREKEQEEHQKGPKRIHTDDESQKALLHWLVGAIWCYLAKKKKKKTEKARESTTTAKAVASELPWCAL